MTLRKAGFLFSRRQVLGAMAAGAGYSLVPAAFAVPSADHALTNLNDGLPRSLPSDIGVDPRAVLDFIDHVFSRDLHLHSFMLYRRGHVAAEGWSWPYHASRPHMMHSLTKSVTACGVGIAIDEGFFSLDDKVVSFFPDELPAESNVYLEAMTVRDLLTMQSGHAKSVSGSVFRQIKTSWVAEFFKIPVVHEPGSHFVYSSALSFMLSAIVSATTGKSLRQFLDPRVFRPLGIKALTWGASPNGINPGGNGLSWTTADALKLGILHLNRGAWNGQQLVPGDWVDESTRLHVPGEAYGYHWWREDSVNAYYAEGAFGQFSIVFPDQDAVLTLTAGVQDEPLLDIVWQYFPTAFDESTSKRDSASSSELRSRTENMRLLPEVYRTHSATEKRISGKTYLVEDNEDHVTAIKLTFGEDALDFELSDHRGSHHVMAGLGKWIESSTSMTGNKLHHQYQSDDMKVVASARWWDEQTLEMTWQFVETAWMDTIVCRFIGDRISFDRRVNANYAPLFRPTIRGTLAGKETSG
ncbi:MAG: serine hydrolase [Xanthomonadales bacterium]|nr:serine hydrolase [Xanthomonadales bacterium]